MFCLLFPEWSPHTWSDQSPEESGQEIEFFSTPGWVGETLGDACPLQERPGPAKDSRDPRAGKEGGGEKPRRMIGWEAGQLVTSPRIFPCLLPSKRKPKLTLPPAYTYTKGKIFLKERGRKKRLEAFLKAKGLFIAAKVLIFFFLPLATIWELETWVEKKSIHLSSHKTSVFHRGNGKISPLTGSVNSYWGLGGGQCAKSREGQVALCPGTLGDLTLPCDPTTDPPRPHVSRRQRRRERGKSQDGTTPRPHPAKMAPFHPASPRGFHWNSF